jgi:hypothetical protein
VSILLDFDEWIRLYFVLRKTESGVGGETRKGLHPKGTVATGWQQSAVAFYLPLREEHPLCLFLNAFTPVGRSVSLRSREIGKSGHREIG